MHSSRIECVLEGGPCDGETRWVDPDLLRAFKLQDGGSISCHVLYRDDQRQGWISPNGLRYVPRTQPAVLPVPPKPKQATLVDTHGPKMDAVESGNERGAGLKFDSGKPRWSLLMQGCAKALAGVAAVLTFGAKKYAAHSWKQVENNKERYRDALYRHLNAIESGELVDPESGLPHWDHVACNALFLSELNKDQPDV